MLLNLPFLLHALPSWILRQVQLLDVVLNLLKSFLMNFLLFLVISLFSLLLKLVNDVHLVPALLLLLRVKHLSLEFASE